jgi:hypothetical protein
MNRPEKHLAIRSNGIAPDIVLASHRPDALAAAIGLLQIIKQPEPKPWPAWLPRPNTEDIDR